MSSRGDLLNQCFLRVSGHYLQHGGASEFSASLTIAKIAAAQQRESMAASATAILEMLREEGAADSGMTPAEIQSCISRGETLASAIREKDWTTDDAKASRRELRRIHPIYERALGGITKPKPELFPAAYDE